MIVPDGNGGFYDDGTTDVNYGAADAATTAADSGGNGGLLSGLIGFGSTVATAITNIYRTTNPPAPGQLVYNPSTGTYQYPGVQAVTTGSSGLLLFGLLAVALIFVLRR